MGSIPAGETLVTTTNWQEHVGKKSGVVVVKRTSLPDINDVLLDYRYPPEVKELLMGSPFREESYEEQLGKLYSLALHCRDLGMSNEAMLVTLTWVAEKNLVPYDEDHGDLIKLIAQARQAPSGSEMLAAINPMEKPERAKVYNFRELLEADFKVDWIVPGLLTEMGILAFCGPSNLGKTQLMLRLAMAMAMGEDFLGYKVSGRPRRILFLSLEMMEPELQRFMKAMAKDFTDEQLDMLAENFDFHCPGTALYLNVNDDRQEYWRLIKEHEPDGVIIDSWSQAVFGELSSDTITRDAFAFMNLVRRQTGCFFGIINHTKKKQGDASLNNLDSVFGSVFFGTSCSSVVVVLPNGNSTNELQLHYVKNRFAEKSSKPVTIRRLDGLNFKVIGGAEVITAAIDSGPTKKKKSIFDMVGVGDNFTIPAPKKGDMPAVFDEMMLGEEGDNPMPGFKF